MRQPFLTDVWRLNPGWAQMILTKLADENQVEVDPELGDIFGNQGQPQPQPGQQQGEHGDDEGFEERPNSVEENMAENEFNEILDVFVNPIREMYSLIEYLEERFCIVEKDVEIIRSMVATADDKMYQEIGRPGFCWLSLYATMEEFRLNLQENLKEIEGTIKEDMKKNFHNVEVPAFVPV